MSTEARARPYGGLPPEQRHARRRRQLLDAGLELFGTRGYAATSIREVCEHAGLNRRYFYESFGSREELFRAVYDEIIAGLAAELRRAVSAERELGAVVRAGLHAFWAHVTADQRAARILTLEVVGVSEELERHRRHVRHAFADFIAAQAMAIAQREGWVAELDGTIATRGLVAQSSDLVVDWMRGDTDLSPAELAEESMKLYAAFARAAFRTADGTPPAELELDAVLAVRPV